MRYLLILPALVLDLLQILIMFGFTAFQFATPWGGGFIGAVVGAITCWSASGTVMSGISNAAACAAAGGVLGGVGSAMAIPLGIAINVVLSLTIGTGIILLLIFTGSFSFRSVALGFLGESLPMLNVAPVWTLMVWRSIYSSNKKEKLAASVKMKVTYNKEEEEGETADTITPMEPSASANRPFDRAQPMQSSSPQQAQKEARTPLLPSRYLPDIRKGVKAVAFALLLLGSVHASPLYAQAVPDPIQYVVSPETPGAYQGVLIEVQGVGSFIGSADITWRKNGAVVLSGIGEHSYQFITAGLGERTTISVSVDSNQGRFTKTFTFTPSRINLVWEAQTTIPPFFRGKARYSGGSPYKVVAFPTVFSNNARIAANALTYQWQYKGEEMPAQSGLGRYVFTNTGDQLQTGEEVNVTVYYGTQKVGYAETFIPATDPLILFYQRDTLRGVLYEQALPPAIALIGKEITLQAEPFYFSSATRKSGLVPFTWTLNNEETTGPDSANGILTLRQSGTGAGSADVGLTMQSNNPDQYVQAAESRLRIEFGTQQSNPLRNFFGL